MVHCFEEGRAGHQYWWVGVVASSHLWVWQVMEGVGSPRACRCYVTDQVIPEVGHVTRNDMDQG